MDMNTLVLLGVLGLTIASHYGIVLRYYPKPTGQIKLDWRDGIFLLEYILWLVIAASLSKWGPRLWPLSC